MQMGWINTQLNLTRGFTSVLPQHPAPHWQADHTLSQYHLRPADHLPDWSFLIHVLNGCVAAAAKSLQSCPTLCDPIDGSPPGIL